jgi:putative restriction endonuclease
MLGLFLAVTDDGWFDYLSSQPTLPEVNFWRPSAMAFHALRDGELLVFKLKSPRNQIGGFGVFSNSTVLSLQEAWETFGDANGAPSYEAFQAAIAQLRTEPVGPSTNIGCRVLTEPVFLPRELRFDPPRSWPRNLQGGKRFPLEDEDGLYIWTRLQEAAQAVSRASPLGFAESGPRFGPPMLITPRLGQGAFRVAVTEAYGRQCALSGGKVLPALDAAHIRPYGEGGVHTKSNGILLRKDIHSVFDAGYATIDPSYRFVVSDKVKEVFNNGEEYRRLHGTVLRLPRNTMDQPDRDLLRWHNENRFLG